MISEVPVYCSSLFPLHSAVPEIEDLFLRFTISYYSDQRKCCRKKMHKYL